MGNTRNKEQTKKKLMNAVGSIIKRQGFRDLGINAVAREAGVDKVLIYRYFENIDGLLEQYIDDREYWVRSAPASSIDLKDKEFNFLRSMMNDIFIGQLNDLKKNPEMQEFMKWELIESNEITRKAAQQREKLGTNIMNNYMRVLDNKDLDIPAITSILVAGIYYIVLRSGTVQVFNSIELDKEEGWSRIETGIRQFIDILFDKLEKN